MDPGGDCISGFSGFSIANRKSARVEESEIEVLGSIGGIVLVDRAEAECKYADSRPFKSPRQHVSTCWEKNLSCSCHLMQLWNPRSGISIKVLP